MRAFVDVGCQGVAVGPSVSVVIPTIGRPELARAVLSAQQQDLAPHEIIVVDDGSMPIAAAGPRSVIVLHTAGGEGAAAARNVGLEAATGELVAFLDDDDVWLPGHLATAAALLQSRPEIDVYACAARVFHTQGERIEPTVTYTGRRSLLTFYFGRTVWARRRRRVLTPTLVFRRAVARHRMDTGLTAMEDLWWLLQVEHAGHRIFQTAYVGVVVHANDDRETARVPLTQNFIWADRLDTLLPGTGTYYLIGHVGRQLARRGNASDLSRLRRGVQARGGAPLDLLLVLALEHVLAHTRRHSAGTA